MYPNYYYPVNQNIPQTMPQQNQPQMQNQPIQNGGYVVVQNEEEIRRYPVAHGNLVTFRIENQPIVVEKSMGYSQFDTPHYDRYRLIKEEMPDAETKQEEKEYTLKSDYETLKNDFLEVQNEIFSQIKQLKDQISELDKKPTTRKKEVD